VPSTKSGGFPAKGDRVSHQQYGTGTITERDVYHTVIDFDTNGVRRFATDRVVLEPTSVPSPPGSERRGTIRSRKKAT
jgi:hypothetical protein